MKYKLYFMMFVEKLCDWRMGYCLSIWHFVLIFVEALYLWTLNVYNREFNLLVTGRTLGMFWLFPASSVRQPLQTSHNHNAIRYCILRPSIHHRFCVSWRDRCIRSWITGEFNNFLLHISFKTPEHMQQKHHQFMEKIESINFFNVITHIIFLFCVFFLFTIR